MICINRNRVLVLLSTLCMLVLIMISEEAWPSELCMEASAIYLVNTVTTEVVALFLVSRALLVRQLASRKNFCLATHTVPILATIRLQGPRTSEND